MHTHTLFAATLAAALIATAAAQAAPAADTNATTRINADQMEFDYEDEGGIIYLKGHVVVRDPKGTLSADNATVYLESGTKDATASEADFRSFSRIVAVGSVRMAASDSARVVLAEKATWTRKDNVIVLTGGPPKAKDGPSFIKAARIVYHVDTRKIEFFPQPEIMLDVPKDQKQKFVQ